jgi:AcrR family transcriptional regulator
VSRRLDAQRRITEAALEAFAERGYHGTTTSEIAREAGVAEGTIFRYFATKKDLLLGVIAPVVAAVVAPIVRRNLQAVLVEPHATPDALFRAILADRLALVRDHPTIMRVLAQEIPIHPELRDQFRAVIFDRLFPLALAQIERFQRAGQIDPDLSPRTVARIVGSVFAGYVVTRVVLAPDAAWDDEREVDAMMRVLTRGLAPSPPP